MSETQTKRATDGVSGLALKPRGVCAFSQVPHGPHGQSSISRVTTLQTARANVSGSRARPWRELPPLRGVLLSYARLIDSYRPFIPALPWGCILFIFDFFFLKSARAGREKSLPSESGGQKWTSCCSSRRSCCVYVIVSRDMSPVCLCFGFSGPATSRTPQNASERLRTSVPFTY